MLNELLREKVHSFKWDLFFFFLHPWLACRDEGLLSWMYSSSREPSCLSVQLMTFLDFDYTSQTERFLSKKTRIGNRHEETDVKDEHQMIRDSTMIIILRKWFWKILPSLLNLLSLDWLADPEFLILDDAVSLLGRFCYFLFIFFMKEMFENKELPFSDECH